MSKTINITDKGYDNLANLYYTTMNTNDVLKGTFIDFIDMGMLNEFNQLYKKDGMFELCDGFDKDAEMAYYDKDDKVLVSTTYGDHHEYLLDILDTLLEKAIERLDSDELDEFGVSYYE